MFIILFFILWLCIWCILSDREIEKNKRISIKKYNALVKRIKHIEDNQNTTFDYINSIYSDLERLDINEKD